MSNQVVDQKVIDLLPSLNFRNQKLSGADFSGKSLKKANFRGASLAGAKFVGCNLTYADFENANLCGADFTDAILHRTNFKDCDLSQTNMAAKDMFGCTITLECKSFQGMKLLPGWWWGWLFYALLMVPPTKDAEDRLIECMGIERYSVLKKQYATRRL